MVNIFLRILFPFLIFEDKYILHYFDLFFNHIDDTVSNPYSITEIDNYKNLEEYYLKAISNLQHGTTELFMHPSYPSKELSAYTKEWKKREYELEFLNSNAFEKRLKDEGVELINYTQL